MDPYLPFTPSLQNRVTCFIRDDRVNYMHVTTDWKTESI
jgi:hypothetical protein